MTRTVPDVNGAEAVEPHLPARREGGATGVADREVDALASAGRRRSRTSDVVGTDGRVRPAWAAGDEQLQAYYDTGWGEAGA